MRKEHRGVGGIFFDDLERLGENGKEKVRRAFAFSVRPGLCERRVRHGLVLAVPSWEWLFCTTACGVLYAVTPEPGVACGSQTRFRLGVRNRGVAILTRTLGASDATSSAQPVPFCPLSGFHNVDPVRFS